MYTLTQSLSLTALIITVMVSWWFDQQFLTQSFTGSFASQQVMGLSILIAGIFACGRVLCYAWLGNRHALSRSQVASFWVGVTLLTLLSFTASTSFVSKSLNNPNLPEAVAAEQKRVKQSFQTKKAALLSREREEVMATNNRFDQDVLGAKDRYQPLITGKEALMADESKRPYKSGPLKGSPYGPIYEEFERQRDAIVRELGGELKTVSAQRIGALQSITQVFGDKRQALADEEQQAVSAITPGLMEDSNAARNPFFTSILKSASSMGIHLLYDQLVVYIAIAVAAVIELMTYGFTASYLNLRKLSLAPVAVEGRSDYLLSDGRSEQAFEARVGKDMQPSRR